MRILKISLTNSALNEVLDMKFVESGVLNEKRRRISQRCSSSQKDILIVESRGRNQSCSPTQRDKSTGKSNKYANMEVPLL